MIRQTFRFNPGGQVFGFYTEAIDLKSIGVIHVVRATDIAFNANTQQWEVTRFGKDEVIFTDPSREECVRWEMANLRPEDEAGRGALRETRQPRRPVAARLLGC